MNDQAHADDIARAIHNLNASVNHAREAGLAVHLTSDEFGQTITALTTREYVFDLTKGDAND